VESCPADMAARALSIAGGPLRQIASRPFRPAPWVGGGLAAAGALLPVRRFSAQAQERTAYDFSVRRVDGSSLSLDEHRGKVLVIVNVASK